MLWLGLILLAWDGLGWVGLGWLVGLCCLWVCLLGYLPACLAVCPPASLLACLLACLFIELRRVCLLLVVRLLALLVACSCVPHRLLAVVCLCCALCSQFASYRRPCLRDSLAVGFCCLFLLCPLIATCVTRRMTVAIIKQQTFATNNTTTTLTQD